METCRTCAKCDFIENGNKWQFINLFHPPVCWQSEISQIHLEFVIWKLKISANDGLPQKICSDCFSQFCSIDRFRVACQEAQLKLAHIFDKIEIGSVEEDETIELNVCNDNVAIEGSNGNAVSNDNDLVELLELPDVVNDNEQQQVALPFETVSNLETETTATTITITATNTAKSAATIATTSVAPYSTWSDLGPGTEPSVHDQASSQQQCTNEPTAVATFSTSTFQHSTNENSSDPNMPSIEYETHIITIPEATADFIENVPAISPKSTDTETHTNLNTAIELLHVSFTCKYCFKPALSYQSQQDLLAHMTNAHDSQQPYNCPECELSFQDAASRTVHIKDQHVEKNYECMVCGKKYGDRCNLRHHIEKYHSETDFECNMCEKRFFTRKSLNYHMKWHNPERQFKCSYCDRLFINRRHLKCHEETHTGLRNTEYCSYCGKAFIHLKTLRWHIYRQHGGEKPYKCANCTEVFASYAEKRVHMLEQHAENLTAIERSECQKCRKPYATEQDLKQHMQQEHLQKKPATPIISNNKRVLQPKRPKQYTGLFECQICGQRFNMKSALERHAAMHSAEGRPHACTLCSKRFKRAQDMKWHMKTHSNEKPNICDVCGKAFALKYVLTQHRRSHEVLEKNFKCTTCGRAYLFEKSLRLHERVHTGKTYYKCDLCGESFVTHIKFKYHIQKMHNTSAANLQELTLDDLIGK